MPDANDWEPRDSRPEFAPTFASIHIRLVVVLIPCQAPVLFNARIAIPSSSTSWPQKPSGISEFVCLCVRVFLASEWKREATGRLGQNKRQNHSIQVRADESSVSVAFIREKMRANIVVPAVSPLCLLLFFLFPHQLPDDMNGRLTEHSSSSFPGIQKRATRVTAARCKQGKQEGQRNVFQERKQKLDR